MKKLKKELSDNNNSTNEMLTSFCKAFIYLLATISQKDPRPGVLYIWVKNALDKFTTSEQRTDVFYGITCQTRHDFWEKLNCIITYRWALTPDQFVSVMIDYLLNEEPGLINRVLTNSTTVLINGLKRHDERYGRDWEKSVLQKLCIELKKTDLGLEVISNAYELLSQAKTPFRAKSFRSLRNEFRATETDAINFLFEAELRASFADEPNAEWFASNLVEDVWAQNPSLLITTKKKASLSFELFIKNNKANTIAMKYCRYILGDAAKKELVTHTESFRIMRMIGTIGKTKQKTQLA